jgi:transposase-like protein
MAKRPDLKVRNARDLRKARKRLRKEVGKREELMKLRTEALQEAIRPSQLGKELAFSVIKPSQLVKTVRYFWNRKKKASASAQSTQVEDAEEEGDEDAPQPTQRGGKWLPKPQWMGLLLGGGLGAYLTHRLIRRVGRFFHFS